MVAPGSGRVLELTDKGEGSVIVYGALATCHTLFLALTCYDSEHLGNSPVFGIFTL